MNAYEQLKAEGYLKGSIGSGTYVSKVLPEKLLQVAGASLPKPQAAMPPRRKFSDYGHRIKLLPNFEMRPTRAFRCNLPALDLFPVNLWTQLTARRLRRASTALLMGCGAEGYPPLRKAVADYLCSSRGVKCVPEQVVIVSGVQEALDLTARVFLNPSDRVGVEEPGYGGASAAFDAAGAKISALPVDSEGVQLPRGASNIRLLYVTPAHQFPAGPTLSLRRRLALLDWARAHEALIFEDDYDSEFRYSLRPVPALQGLDQHGTVLFAGSFSKVMFPALRLGYMVLPGDLAPKFAAAKSVTSRHAPLLEQAVLYDFMEGGHFARHLRKMREVYAERLAVLMESARTHLAGILEISEVEAGLQTVGWLQKGLNGELAAKAALTRKIDVTPLSRSCRTPSLRGRMPGLREGLQIGFAAINPREIRMGVEQLAAALEELS